MNNITIKTLTSVLLGLAINASCAFAQDSAAPAGAQAGATPGEVPGDEPRLNWNEKESLFLQDLTDKYLADTGFTPLVVWTGEQWSNASGGIKTGTTWDSLFTLGFEQDISKLAGKSNLGTIGLSAFYYTSSGDFTGDYVGANSDASNIFSGEMMRVFEIFYTNEFEGEYGITGFRVGQLAADEDFMGMDYADIFLNSNFGAIPANAGVGLYNGANAFSQYSLATVGATVYFVNDDFDVIFGLYNGNAGEDLSGNHGFDYSLQSVAFWYQFGYNYELFGLGGRAQFGGNYNSGRFEIIDSGGLTSRNFYSFYLGLQQDFYADEEGNAIIGGFVRLAWAPQGTMAEVQKYLDTGLNWFGPIPTREDDVLGVGVSIMQFSGPARTANDYSNYETMMETTYKFQFTPAISLQPAFQIYFNSKNEVGETRAAYVAGARLEVIF